MDQDATFLRAVIFDCDGVLVDSEPLHFSAFKKVLSTEGFGLDEETYKKEFLALDDRGLFQKFYERERLPLSIEQLKAFMEKKTKIFQELVLSDGLLPYPAVTELVMALSQRYPLAVASGARRHELDMVLESAGLRPYFEVIVSSDDVSQGKPNPESFLKAVEGLNANGKRSTAIKPEECLVIEDSFQGISSAHQAGMKCVAVATSYAPFELKEADLIVPSISSLRVSQIEDLFQRQKPLPMLHQTN